MKRLLPSHERGSWVCGCGRDKSGHDELTGSVDALVVAVIG